MRSLFILRGAPGSGKTTFIKNNGLEPYTLSSDMFRLVLSQPRLDIYGNKTINKSTKVTKMVFEQYLNQALKNRLFNGDLTFIDTTAFTRKEIMRYKKLCKDYFYHMYIVDFTNIPIDVAKERNLKREEYKIVPEKDIDKFYNRFKNEDIPESIKVLMPEEVIPFLKSQYNYDYFDFNKYKQIIHIGDIHGCYTSLIDAIGNNGMLDKNNAYVFVGDYFDRGSENEKVFDYLYSIKDNPNVYLLIGNHELRFLEYFLANDEDRNNKFKIINSILKTHTIKELKSFYGALIPALVYKHGKDKNLVFVSHAGISKPVLSSTISAMDYIKGPGAYEDMEKVCNSFSKFASDIEDKTGLSMIQIFGHRNSHFVPISIDKYNYNLCGDPEYKGDLRSLSLTPCPKFNGNPLLMDFYTPNKIINKNTFIDGYKKYPEMIEKRLIEEDYIDIYTDCNLINIKKFDNISSFNFSKDAFFNKQWDTITTKARGLFVNTKTKKIVARSYDKFFNFEELPESSLHTILTTYKGVLTGYEKMDGYLALLGYDDESDELIYTSKSVISGYELKDYYNYADHFKYIINGLFKNKDELKLYLKDLNATLVFEVCDSDFDPHIIKYDRKEIILLDIIYNKFKLKSPLALDKGISTEYAYELMLSGIINRYFGNNDEYSIRPKKKLVQFPVSELKNHLEELRYPGCNKTNNKLEGYVFISSDGKMFKLKTRYYEIEKIKRSISENLLKSMNKSNIIHSIRVVSYDIFKSHYKPFRFKEDELKELYNNYYTKLNILNNLIHPFINTENNLNKWYFICKKALEVFDYNKDRLGGI